MISIRTVTSTHPMPLRTDSPSSPPGTDPTPWIRTHQKGVWRYLRTLGCDPALADDLTQDAFLVALDADFQHRSHAQSWTFLKQTARNLWLGRQRRSRREAQALADAVDVLWQDRVTPGREDARVAAMQNCIRSLQGRSAEVVQLFYRDGLSRAEAADRMGLKETGVKTLLQRVRAVLKDCVEGER